MARKVKVKKGEKRTMLPLTKRKEIANYRVKNPDLPIDKLAEYFNCTIFQARYAVQKARNGTLSKKSTGKGRAIQAKLLMKNETTTKLFDGQLHYALAQMEATDTLDAMGRVSMLEKIARAQKAFNEYEMQVHLKGIDMKAYIETIRMFKPDASKKEILKIFNEAKERCKISQD